MLKMTIPFAIPWSIILLFKHFLIFKGLISIIIYGSLFTILYCITAYLLCMNTYEKNIVKAVPKRVVKKFGGKIK